MFTTLLPRQVLQGGLRVHSQPPQRQHTQGGNRCHPGDSNLSLPTLMRCLKSVQSSHAVLPTCWLTFMLRFVGGLQGSNSVITLNYGSMGFRTQPEYLNGTKESRLVVRACRVKEAFAFTHQPPCGWLVNQDDFSLCRPKPIPPAARASAAPPPPAAARPLANGKRPFGGAFRRLFVPSGGAFGAFLGLFGPFWDLGKS